VFKSPEVCRVYISSFWDKPYSKSGWTAADLFDSEKHDLYTDIRDIPRYAAIRRVNELIKRARLSRSPRAITRQVSSYWAGVIMPTHCCSLRCTEACADGQRHALTHCCSLKCTEACTNV
jgi:hypothetical protein